VAQRSTAPGCLPGFRGFESRQLRQIMPMECERQHASLVRTYVAVRARSSAPGSWTRSAVVGTPPWYGGSRGFDSRRVLHAPVRRAIVRLVSARCRFEYGTGLQFDRYGVAVAEGLGAGLWLRSCGFETRRSPRSDRGNVPVRQWCWCGLQNRGPLVRLQPPVPCSLTILSGCRLVGMASGFQPETRSVRDRPPAPHTRSRRSTD
jgi:hypothetical protein